MSDKGLLESYRSHTRPSEELTRSLGGKVVKSACMDRPDGNEERVIVEFTDGSALILEARNSGSGPYLFNRYCKST
jgi:hypothetical protein